jgi:hypothetical protein
VNQVGYSGTPLPKKLGIDPSKRVKVINPPSGFLPVVQPFIDADDSLDVCIAFCLTLADLDAAFEWRSELKANGGLWIGWPKKSSKIPTEITEQTLRDVGLPLGIVDNKVCAIDEAWSGLRFVWRKELRDRIQL